MNSLHTRLISIFQVLTPPVSSTHLNYAVGQATTPTMTQWTCHTLVLLTIVLHYLPWWRPVLLTGGPERHHGPRVSAQSTGVVNCTQHLVRRQEAGTPASRSRTTGDDSDLWAPGRRLPADKPPFTLARSEEPSGHTVSSARWCGPPPTSSATSPSPPRCFTWRWP